MKLLMNMCVNFLNMCNLDVILSRISASDIFAVYTSNNLVTGMKCVLIVLLCFSCSFADERDECLVRCAKMVPPCVPPFCKQGYKMTNEICISGIYSCCPTCVKE